MNIRIKTLLPGTIILSKRYNIFKRLWYKLVLKKELPYNYAILFPKETKLIDTFSSKCTDLLLEIKKRYNKGELEVFNNYVKNKYNIKNTADIYNITFKNNSLKELSLMLNVIRPYSFSNIEDIETTNTKIRSKYYVTKLVESEGWEKCIY